ncbi:YviE OS=Ureibacillus acetophenoni OX=614649 GN=SAMN05877842_101184 PE=4 SV=1 [Ureibacillus acetophenoni]
MRIPKIQITTSDIKVDMQISDPIQKINQKSADLKIDQPAAILDISSTSAKLLIDQSKAWRDLGLLTTKESIAKYAQDGQQAVLKRISKDVREGRQMMESAGKGTGSQIAANIAKQNHGPKQAPINIKFIPSVGSVDINYVPGNLDVNVTPQKPRIDVQVNRPTHNYTPGTINHEVVQYPSIDIEVME